MKMKSLIPALCLLSISVGMGAQTVVTDTLELSKGVATTPAQLLKGKVAGVRVSATDGNPSGVTNTNIRGLNSIRGNNEPLWIVDGAILSNSIGETQFAFWQDKFGDYSFMSQLSQMDNWNLYDIESIQVLKNISATALYGSRGANGVIIITTKMPAEDKWSFDWDSNVGINFPGVKSGYLNPGFSHNHSITAGASAGRTRYRLSAFFRDVEGNMKGVSNGFGGLRVMFDTKANAVVHFGMNFSLSAGAQNSQNGTSWYGAPSTTLAIRGIPMMDGRMNDAQGWLDTYSDDTRIFRTTDSFYLNLNFTPSFRWKTSASVDYQTNNRYLWYGTGTAFGAASNAAAGISMASLFNVDGKSSLQYEHFFARNHHVNIEAGAELIYSFNRFNTMNGTDFFYQELKARGFSFRESFDDPAILNSNQINAGFFATVAYDFKGLVGFDATMRLDRNMKYDDKFFDLNNLYPAANAFVDLKGLFLKDSSVLSSLRLEGGLGWAGFGRYIPYETFSNFTSGAYTYADDQTAAYFDGYQRLRSREYNATVKAGIFNDRITGSLTYYNKETSDQLDLYQFGHAAASGLWIPNKRVVANEQKSKIANKGFELELGAKIIAKKDLTWSVSATAAFNTNTLVEVDPLDVKGLKMNPDELYVNKNIVGKPVASIFGNILDSSYTIIGEGIIGNPVPKFFGGLETALRVKRFTFDVQADYAGGFDILNMNRMLSSEQIVAPSTFVEKGDYLKISNVSVKYQIPMRNVKWVKSLAVSLTATNLVTLTGYSGFDPDVNCFGYTNLSAGIDYGSYPFMRTVMLGIHANF